MRSPFAGIGGNDLFAAGVSHPACGTMGIRFFCPNGHKLNVKTFLAGKRGLCPKCGAKVLIPSASDPAASKSPDEEALPPKSTPEQHAPSESAPEQPTPPELPPPIPPSPPGAGDEPDTPRPPASDASDPLIFEELDFNALEAFTRPKDPGPSRHVGSVESSGELSWYVRLPSGGQFGPATSDVIRSWIAEGRVSADSLIWREGWRDWRVASSEFPELAAEEEMAQLRSIAPRRPSPSSARTTSAKQKPTSFSRTALVIILVTVAGAMVLSGALIWRLFSP